MGYTANYGMIEDLAARDEAAISDTKDYLGEERFGFLVAELEKAKAAEWINQMNIAFSFAGISGLPFHAMCRKYALAAYREWMHSGDDAVMTDERGHRIE
jgi:hypothetical protein